jgi:hypothetical protein
MQPGMAPKPMMIRHILSTAAMQLPLVEQVAGDVASSSWDLKAAVVMSRTSAAQS